MKKILLTLSVAALMAGLASCGGNGGTKFKPAADKSEMSDSERRAAIAKARSQADGVLDEMLAMRGVKVSVLAPEVPAGFSRADAEAIAARLVNICAANGISGLGTSPGFVLGSTIIPGTEQTTGTVPQKTVVEFELVYSVGNVATGTIFASTTQRVTGAGKSAADARRNALKEIKSTPALQKMLSEASDRIVAWYDENLPTLRSQVESARSRGDYALALAYIDAVPQQSAAAFAYADETRPALFEAWCRKTAADNFAAMRAAVAAANNTFDPAAAGYFALIPSGSPEYAAADTLFTRYQARCDARVAELEAGARADTAAAREFRKVQMAYDQQKDLAQIEADKVVATAEAKASAAAMQREMEDARHEKRKGFWSKIGDRIIGGIDALRGGDDDDDD